MSNSTAAATAISPGATSSPVGAGDFPLEPGKAVHVPFMAPHLVRNGPGVSISFSITWRSEWSYREEYAHRMNSLLRQAGLSPARPGRYPEQNHLKSLDYRAINKARKVTGLGR